MKANELRIGNWVLDRNDFGMMVVSIDSYDLLLNFPENEGDPFDALIDEIKPIQLTEEWLLRLGFVKHHKLTGVYTLGALEFYFVTVKGVDKKYCYVNDRGIGEKIQYVNQLQNLYFALTGEELTLTDG